ncbi:MAG: isoleucine--tRNA ligase [Victivallaceae bacterium]|nr:isoleucine--tRNA ligase [Victivallaceae bacterium]
MFEEVSSQVDFPKMEESIQKFWRENDTFFRSKQQREGRNEFVFYDGPPFATGLPHYGHLLAGTIKDAVPRYQSMKGYLVRPTFGWDCHGLPVEHEMEKQLQLSSKRDIEAYGIDKFNEQCRSIVLRYTSEWESVVSRMGRWVDFKGGYRTMDLNYMESIWWVFKNLWDKQLIYEGNKILPYCPHCATPLSNFEANQGYADVVDPAITIAFRSETDENTSFLAWTTTPWTLFSNLALAVGPAIDYVKVADNGKFYIMAENRLGAYYKEAPEIVWRGKGVELEHQRYQPLFGNFKDLASDGAFQVILADYVSTEDGTGIVHIAPGFGEDDAAAAAKYKLPVVCPIDEECKFTAEVPEFQGRYVKECDNEVIARLKAEGKLVHRGTIKHSYPHCWRDDGPLIYRAVSTWFVDIGRIKDKMLHANAQTSWVPAHIRDGRFGKWLENARDWAISRNRYWGTPLPIWRNEEGETICVGSVAELEKLTGQKVNDLHKHFVDDLQIPSPTGKSALKRIPEVLDCWFESGSMPYAQNHYPFENKAYFESHFPADFIAEGLDQTRGWFYTLVVLAAALFDRPPFKNVIVNGIILAENGQKMSKRKRNYPDPMEVVNRYGADALRLFMLGSPVVRAEDLKFSEDGVREVLRAVMIPMWNAYSFFVTYARLDNFRPTSDRMPEKLDNVLDRWILSSLSQMVEEISTEMDHYNLQKAANRFTRFVDDLTNWYIRRSRRRFWKSSNDADKAEAYATLYYVLLTFAKTAAPFIPFTTEAIYRNLRMDSMPESVHLCDYPTPEQCRDERLERQMDLAMRTVKLGRFLRTQGNLKVRQPLGRAVVVAANAADLELLRGTESIIAEELNVKAVEFTADEASLVSYRAKANFKVLGKKLGPKMKEAAAQIEQLASADLAALVRGGRRKVQFSDGSEFEIGAEDLAIQRDEREGMTVASEDGVTIALDTRLTVELEREGFARELVSRLQNLRKELAFEVADRIEVVLEFPDEASRQAAEEFHDYIAAEVLASKLSYAPVAPEERHDLAVNTVTVGASAVKA